MPLQIHVDLPKRVFAVHHGGLPQRFGIPDGYDVRVTDLKQMIDAAAEIGRVESDRWWEFTHNQKAERSKYNTTRFTLTYVGEKEFGACYVEWECDSKGYERGRGLRGISDQEDRLGGIITSQQLDGISYSLANNEKSAMEEGYALEGGPFMRVIDDDEADVLVQARIRASWSKPRRWSAVPLRD
jgi:hypothetical protein